MAAKHNSARIKSQLMRALRPKDYVVDSGEED